MLYFVFKTLIFNVEKADEPSLLTAIESIFY